MAYARPVHIQSYLGVAQEAHDLMDRLLKGWVGSTSEEAQEDPLPTMIHVTCQNHCRRLSALLMLHEAGLADVGTTFVRLGYDELVWLSHFSTQVPKEERYALLQALTGREVVKRYQAQRKYHGADGHQKFGFSAAAHEELEKQVPKIEAEMKRLRSKLAWRKARYGPLEEPSVLELAEKLGIEDHHAFYNTAPSQFMHFSAWRLRAGVTRGEDGKAIPRNAYLDEIDAGFALGWVANDALNVAYLADSWSPGLGDMLRGIDSTYKLRAKHLIARIDLFGPPPLLEAYQLMD